MLLLNKPYPDTNLIFTQILFYYVEEKHPGNYREHTAYTT